MKLLSADARKATAAATSSTRPIRQRAIRAGRWRPRGAAGAHRPADAEPELLARYLMTIANGLAVQAAGGATREDLRRVAEVALRNWPPA